VTRVFSGLYSRNAEMPIINELSVPPNGTVREAMKILSRTGEKCLVITTEDGVVCGTLSDGDLRKAIVKGVQASDSIEHLFQRKSTVLVEGEYTLSAAKKLFIDNKFDLIPVVDKHGKLVEILLWEDIFGENQSRQKKQPLGLPVIIMAGGKGTRLEPFTKILPKPLIPINEKPIIEHILDQFLDVGVDEFIVSINYKARILRAFFEERDPSFSITFIEESHPRGTVGSLRELRTRVGSRLFVTNCDILVRADYLDIRDFHVASKNAITLVVSTEKFTVPYGTCELDESGQLRAIEEKPNFEFLVNTGLYVLESEVLNLIPDQRKYDFPELIDAVLQRGLRIGVYPVDDDAWIDIGQWAEYEKAVGKLVGLSRQ
jgi:dTDP-glucose pyrophosphorylase